MAVNCRVVQTKRESDREAMNKRISPYAVNFRVLFQRIIWILAH